MLVVLEYRSKGPIEWIANRWRAVGRRMRLDLKHFRRYVMRTESDDLPEPEEDEEIPEEAKDEEASNANIEDSEDEGTGEESEEESAGESEEGESDDSSEDESEDKKRMRSLRRSRQPSAGPPAEPPDPPQRPAHPFQTWGVGRSFHERKTHVADSGGDGHRSQRPTEQKSRRATAEQRHQQALEPQHWCCDGGHQGSGSGATSSAQLHPAPPSDGSR